MSETKYQGGPYQPNPAYPPLVTNQGPPVMAVVIPQPAPTYERFDKKKAKFSAIVLLVLGCITAIVTLVFLPLGILAVPVPIVAGVFGILSAQQPSNMKIVCFMVLSIISAVIAAIMVLVSIAIVAVGSNAAFDASMGLGLLIAGIIGILLYGGLTLVSIYCSVLCSKEVNCCGGSANSAQAQGVVHGQVHQPGIPGGQFAQPQNPPAQPPTYTQAIQQA